MNRSPSQIDGQADGVDALGDQPIVLEAAAQPLELPQGLARGVDEEGVPGDRLARQARRRATIGPALADVWR